MVTKLIVTANRRTVFCPDIPLVCFGGGAVTGYAQFLINTLIWYEVNQ